MRVASGVLADFNGPTVTTAAIGRG
jgi:hypothetical protein